MGAPSPHVRSQEAAGHAFPARCAFCVSLCGAEERLSALAKHQHTGAVLGWLSYRPGTSLAACSMREAAVTQALLLRQQQQQQQQQQVSSGPPVVLLLLVTTRPDHDGGTLTWQYRCALGAGAGPRATRRRQHALLLLLLLLSAAAVGWVLSSWTPGRTNFANYSALLSMFSHCKPVA